LDANSETKEKGVAADDSAPMKGESFDATSESA
jgi:hypothetical protein